jgi:tetratricopeptide (TPR) repeat protein/class 3 adenylate cyclase
MGDGARLVEPGTRRVTEKRRPMSPERWRRVQDILGAAIDCQPDARGALVAARCGDDQSLREDVETLLAAHDSDGPLDRMARGIAQASLAHTAGQSWEGRTVGRYVVGALVGAGGMGHVYRARDRRLERDVALKVLSPHLSTEPAAKQRFLGEARAAAALEHPSVCTIHEIGETDDGQLFIAMPLYAGETLQARLRRGRLRFADAMPLVEQVAHGLARAHASGIVHRDVKPSNIMLLEDGAVKILDFGIAKIGDSSLTLPGAMVGSVPYMSPEQIRGGSVDARADVWSLAIVVHEMLTGRLPFAGEERQQIAEAIRSADPALVTTSHPEVPARLDRVLSRALAKRPEDRHPSMLSFAADLAALHLPESGAAPGERRRATVLVTRVSNYATLVEHMTHAEAHRLVDDVRDMAVDIVGRHGGVVNQAIDEETVAIFGVPSAHEDDELRAVRAALELHARVAGLAGDRPGDSRVRVQSGLDAGPMVVQPLDEGPRRYAIVGTPPQTAAMLARLAPDGAVVVSADCQRLVAPFVRTEPCDAIAGEREGQGTAAFRVTGATGLETRLEVSERAGLTPYVGRQSEVALLEAHVIRACAGEGRIVAVVGEAGAGKSRLLHELRERVAHTQHVRLLNGRCRAYGDVAPCAPFIDIVREALELELAADSAAVVRRIRAIDVSLEPFLPLYLHLLSVASESHPLPRHLQGEHLQAPLLDALAALLTAVAAHRPVTVLLEDWHWADAASRAALDRIAEIVAAHPLLFIVTSRHERDPFDRWPAHGTRIQLEPLGYEASTAIMRAVLRADVVAEELARRVFERAGGNPFFLEQVCWALVEQAAVIVQGGKAVARDDGCALSLPDTVQAVIRTRLDKLEPDAREVLRVASVIGREFQHAILARAVGPGTGLAAAIQRLKAVGLVQEASVAPEPIYRFRHVLTRDVSYDSLLAYQRASLHEVVGRALESRLEEGLDDRRDDHAGLLMHHFACAGAWPEAIRYGRLAAERASALSQFADALATRDRVLAWLERLPDDEATRELRAVLLLEQERECETLGLRGRQRQIVSELIAHLAPLGPSTRLAEAYLRQGDLLTLLKHFGPADRALGTALRISREYGDAALERNALRSIGLLRWHEGRFPEALAITEHALAIDRACGADLAVVGDLTNLGNILKGMGNHAAALSRIEEAQSILSRSQDPKKLSYALHTLANVHREMGNLDAALACLRRADEASRVHFLPIQRSFHLTSMAHIHLQQGNLDGALENYHEAVALSRRARHAEGLAQSLRTLANVLYGLGRDADALPLLLEVADLFAQLEDPASEATTRARAAAILGRRDRPAEALEAWRRVASICEQIDDKRGRLDALEGVARATRALDPEPAASIAAFATALDLASTLGERRRALGLHNTLGILHWQRGAYAEALIHYENALALVADHGDARQEAVILNSVGATLTRLHRAEEARTALEEGLARSRDAGDRRLEAHALAALGQVARSVGRLDRAVEHFRASLALRRELHDRAGEGWMLRRLAETWFALGDSAAAEQAAAAATQVAGDAGDPALIAACRTTITAL